jgi:hypothetical protein
VALLGMDGMMGMGWGGMGMGMAWGRGWGGAGRGGGVHLTAGSCLHELSA